MYPLYIITTDPPTKTIITLLINFIFNKISFDLPFFFENYKQYSMSIHAVCNAAYYTSATKLNNIIHLKQSNKL